MTPPSRATRFALCLSACLMCSAPQAQTSNTSAAPAPRPLSTPTRVQAAAAPVGTSSRNYALNLAQLIGQSQQIILLTPNLVRADIAEAIRKAILGRGSEVVVLTTRSSLIGKNSLTFRLALMRTKTYTVNLPDNAQSILLLDGAAYVGTGVSGRGSATRMPLVQNIQTVKWFQNTLQTLEGKGDQVDQVSLVRLWYKTNQGKSLW